MWLTEAGIELPSAIPNILELTDASLKVRPDIAVTLTPEELIGRASAAMERVLDSVGSELDDRAPWAADRGALARSTADRAFARFSDAFDRWRQLYAGARAQLEEANRKSEIHGLPAEERKEAKARQAQAQEQIILLERGNSSGNTDFFSYRYLATEGFLPGYNFPRLPLYAFIPSGGYQGGNAAFLQRARFLAISEFGPRSLIYHEGRAYRVKKVDCAAEVRTPGDGSEPTGFSSVRIAGRRTSGEVERCTPVAARWPAQSVFNVLRIDNVETAPAERITANDEERQRQGFDIQTVFAWPKRTARPIIEADVAKIRRFLPSSMPTVRKLVGSTKGLRRRRRRPSSASISIRAAGTGRRGRMKTRTDVDMPRRPRAGRADREGQQECAPLSIFGDPLSPETLTTFQHALMRGIEVVFQLEERRDSGGASAGPRQSARNSGLRSH